MPKYFTHLASNNVPKNALQRQALGVLEYYSNRLIDDPDTFLKGLEVRIQEHNAGNPRCQPLRVTSNRFRPDSIGVYLGAHFTVSFHIYRVKEESQ